MRSPQKILQMLLNARADFGLQLLCYVIDSSTGIVSRN